LTIDGMVHSSSDTLLEALLKRPAAIEISAYKRQQPYCKKVKDNTAVAPLMKNYEGVARNIRITVGDDCPKVADCCLETCGEEAGLD
jgi:hypothetical protein